LRLHVIIITAHFDCGIETARTRDYLKWLYARWNPARFAFVLRFLSDNGTATPLRSTSGRVAQIGPPPPKKARFHTRPKKKVISKTTRAAPLFTATYNDSHVDDDDDGDETPPWWRRRRVAARLYVNSCVRRPRGRPLYARNKVPHSRPTAAGTSQPPRASSAFPPPPVCPLSPLPLFKSPWPHRDARFRGNCRRPIFHGSIGPPIGGRPVSSELASGQSYRTRKSKNFIRSVSYPESIIILIIEREKEGKNKGYDTRREE